MMSILIPIQNKKGLAQQGLLRVETRAGFH